MITFLTHLIGSQRGYRQLACSPQLPSGDAAALCGVDFGQPVARQGVLQQLVLGRRLPSGRYAVTACVPGPADDAGRPTVEFRSIVMSEADWTMGVRGAMASLLQDPLWGSDAFRSGGSVTWQGGWASEARPVELGPVIRAVSAGRGVLLQDGDAGSTQVLDMLASVPRAAAADLCWGLGLMKIPPSLGVATVSGAAGGPSRHVRPMSDWASMFAEEEAAAEASDAAGVASPVLPGWSRWPLPFVAILAVVLVWLAWPRPVLQAPPEMLHATDTPPRPFPAAPVPTAVPLASAPVVDDPPAGEPRPAHPEVAAPLDDRDVRAEPPVSQPVAPSHPEPKPPPGQVVPRDPIVVAAAVVADYEAATAFLPSPTLRQAGMETVIQRVVQQACGAEEDVPVGSELLQLLAASAALDRTWSMMGSGAIPRWASPETTEAWLQEIPARPRSDRRVRIDARLKALGRILTSSVGHRRLVAAMDHRWQPPGVDCTLRSLATTEVEGIPVWEAVRPGMRWPASDIPIEAIRASQGILRADRANMQQEELP